jgi:hypothetical protein
MFKKTQINPMPASHALVVREKVGERLETRHNRLAVADQKSTSI